MSETKRATMKPEGDDWEQIVKDTAARICGAGGIFYFDVPDRAEAIVRQRAALLKSSEVAFKALIGDEDIDPQEAVDMLRAAIAKAKGEA